MNGVDPEQEIVTLPPETIARPGEADNPPVSL